MIYIGIDTGTNTGIAVWDSRGKALLQVETMKIHKAMEVVKGYKDIAKGNGTTLEVRVEDPRQRTWYEPMSRERERAKLQGVGSVKRDASIWDDFLKDLGVRYEMVAPKWNMTKLTKESFKAITGWKKPTNEHNRDAAMLVFGL